MSSHCSLPKKNSLDKKRSRDGEPPNNSADVRQPCHVYQGPSTTSTRTRIGAIAGECHNNELREAHREAEEIGDSERAKKTRRALETIERKERVKAEMIERSFQFVHECPGKAVSSQLLSQGYVVVDGSTEQMSPLPDELRLPCGESVSPHILRLKNDDLRLIDPSPDPTKGVALFYQGSKTPVFLVAPKNESFGRHNFRCRTQHKAVRKAARKMFEVDRFGGRGKERLVLFDKTKCSNGSVKDGYACLGPKVQRGGTGVSSYSYHADHAPREYNTLHNLAARLEHTTLKYIPSNDLHDIGHAHKALKWPRFRAVGDKSKECQMYAGFNVSSGSYHNMHLDDDFVGYTTIVLFDPVYQEDDDNTVVKYFCFPRLGIAMGLRVGDVMIFNSREYHCSSSASVERQIFSFGGYVKTAHVGGNDNSLPLTDHQVKINEYMKAVEASRS